MADYTVTVTRTRTIVSSTDIDVTAKDEESAEKKANAAIEKSQKQGGLDAQHDWDEQSTEDEFEYEVTEA